MNYKNTLAALCLIGSSLMMNAQNNLVPNPSFDETEKKVKKGEGEIMLATGWFSPSEENPADLYSEGNKKGYGTTENNDRGYEETNEGSNYAGIRVYSYRNQQPNTYIQTKLVKPLIAGKTYCVKFNISLADLSKYASANIGMYISEKKTKEKDIAGYTIRPQVMSRTNKVFDDAFVWETVCATFTAKGGERYITIGNFKDPSMIDIKKETKKVKRPKGMQGVQNPEAYYFVEEVSVINMEELDDCSCGEGGDEMAVVYKEEISEMTGKSPAETIALTTVYFNNNSVDPNNVAKLDEVAELMMANPDLKLTITGHADKRELDSFMGDISIDRAKAVYQYLIDKGVSADRLEYNGVQNNDPADSTGTMEAAAKNRRVSFSL